MVLCEFNSYDSFWPRASRDGINQYCSRNLFVVSVECLCQRRARSEANPILIASPHIIHVVTDDAFQLASYGTPHSQYKE
ncbi:hypothetical protein CDAR_552751 [Caerostris darwini]|uniref:Uncharacterized protein n=1 Tax=Caerostris darwini TaxID=1538125 RepID=A0AAV4M399_9ARAC|nr:hypothetical protein CDAR_552751 [Caerostris darwini]